MTEANRRGSNYDVEILPEFVQLTYAGKYSKQAMLEIIDAALENALSHGKGGVLFNLADMHGEPPGPMERFLIGVNGTLLQRSKPRLIKMAVYGKAPMIHPQKFGEAVAVNRYGVVKVSTNIDEVIAWLGPPDPAGLTSHS